MAATRRHNRGVTLVEEEKWLTATGVELEIIEATWGN
jgi:hypothetical protein